jgi:beta-glucosidase
MKNLHSFLPVSFVVLAQKSLLPALLVCALAVSVHAVAQAPLPDSPAIEAKAHALLAKLTLEQKITLIGGSTVMMGTQPMPSIGLPSLRMSDGPVGVRSWGPTTAYPSGVSLAASWDPGLMREEGVALARDARARGVNFLLGPGVNIARSPRTGRNFEYFSEDPFLNSAMVVQYVEGVQSQGVVATVKHYALNNQEFNRHNASSDVDERTMREIYFPAFEAAVIKGHADSVMNSYNLVNGVHATQNEFLNLNVLKGDWGFKGVLMSDWDATYDAVGAANYGLDLEMPYDKFMNAQNLLPAIQSGQVKESTIDDKVLRLLRLALRYRFMDRPQFDPTDSTYSVADRAVALRGALESITLLKNEGNLLPLDPAKIKTIAIIGPNAYPAVTGGGGSSLATPFEPISTVTGIANLLGSKVAVLYDRGLPEASDFFDHTAWVSGVQVETFPSTDFTGTPVASMQTSINDWRPDTRGPEQHSPRSIRYTADFKADKTGKYLVLGAGANQDSRKFLIDGKQLEADRLIEGHTPQSWELDLQAGQTIHVQADYQPHDSQNHISFGIAYEPDLVTDEARKIASQADVVVVAVGFERYSEGEGHDRTFDLPWGEDQLIESIAAANQHTIVTITGGVGTSTSRWLDKVPALLQLYYPGQEGGTAVADIIFGKHDPEGRLPVTFDHSWVTSASYPYFYPTPGADTSLHVTETGGHPVDYTIEHIRYGDRLMVGYRYWTTTGKHPLFPFGYGLSYTTFSFSKLQAPTTAESGSTVTVGFDVTNTGKVEGAEVAQLYISDPSAKVDRPERELKGFEKVRLAPGETKHITLTLDARAFSYWDTPAHKWTIDPGRFIIRVGDSSENTPLLADLTLQ